MVQTADNTIITGKIQDIAKARVRIAVQKSGRLAGPTMDLLRQSGVDVESDSRRLIQRSSGFPADILFVRDDDIPGYITSGACDLGILGLNEFLEQADDTLEQLTVIKKLGFSRCRLSIACVEGDSEFQRLSDLENKTIATSYPHILKRFLKEKSIKCKVVSMQGSVEIAPALGIADLICDLVSTGSTLKSNGLKEVFTILESEAILLSRSGRSDSDLIQKLTDRIDAIYNARTARYIMMNAPKEALLKISRIIPGLSNPTVMPLTSSGSMIAIHAVSEEPVFWNTLEKLKDAGATSIIVSPIEKLIK